MPGFPKVLGYCVYFWSNEGKPLEAVHIHASIGKPVQNGTKFWIRSDGKLELAHNNSHIQESDLRKLQKALEDYSDIYITKWEDYFQEPAKYHDLQE